jgi:hypothetical protein
MAMKKSLLIPSSKVSDPYMTISNPTFSMIFILYLISSIRFLSLIPYPNSLTLTHVLALMPNIILDR